MTEFDRTDIAARTHRLIASRYPTIGLFDDLADNEDELRIAFALEQATNPRYQLVIGRLNLLPEGSLVVDELGASMAMAAFVHTSEEGGRFHDGSLGAWYASLDIDTSIAETVYHSDRRLRASSGIFPATIQMRELISDMGLALLDIRAAQDTDPELYDRDDYGASQVFSKSIRWPMNGPGEDGLIFDSVRREGGENVCIFRPKALGFPIRQGDHYQYMWDDDGAVSVSRLSNIEIG